MAKPILLLGAGASVDAGLPNAYELTQRVYDRLPEHSKDVRKLYGYVVAKLLTRQSRAGNSPFDPLNVEQVYDALKRFLARDSDVLAEFVYSWDVINSTPASNFEVSRFAEKIGSAFSLKQGLSSRVGIAADGRKLREAATQIARALRPAQPEIDLESSLRPYLKTLVECLQSDGQSQAYINKLTGFCKENGAAVATLNYDMLLEESCDRQGISYDYGLSSWNSRKYVKFLGSDIKIIKLHGSVSWYEDDDNILINPEQAHYLRRGLIFGGQNDKLVPHGPYLQLRHEFQRMLRSTNVLGIVGYSFQDKHLNAIIRAWISSRLRAKLVILDPGISRLRTDALGKWYTSDKSGKIIRYNVEIEHIRAGAGDGMDKMLRSLLKTPNPQKVDATSK